MALLKCSMAGLAFLLYSLYLSSLNPLEILMASARLLVSIPKESQKGNDSELLDWINSS